MSKQSKSKSKSKSNKEDDTNINIKILEELNINDTDTYNNFILLHFYGPDINYVIINTIRRVIMELVPSYAFDKDDIIITNNTSIYNNDYIKLRLSNFPVIGINNSEETISKSIDLEYESNITKFDQKIEDINIIAEKEQEIKLEKANNFIIHINVKNTTQKNMAITTDNTNIKFYYKTKPINSPYKRPLLILYLKPDEEFIGTLTSSLNIGFKCQNFMPVAVCCYGEESEQSYKFKVESLKQLSEKEIIIRACRIVILKLNKFIEIFTNKINNYISEKVVIPVQSNLESTTQSAIQNGNEEYLDEHKIQGLIKIENESHTFGNLITRYLQEHPATLFAGYKIDHLLIKELVIEYKTDGTDIINIINDSMKKAIDIFNIIIQKMNNL